MKKTLLLLAFAATSAIASVTFAPPTNNGWQPIRSTSNVGPSVPTEEACWKVNEEDLEKQGKASNKSTLETNYRCVSTSSSRGKYTKDVVPPVVVPPVVVPPVDHHNGGVQPGNMPNYNPATIPTAAVGSSTFDVRQTGAQPYRDNDGTGAFRTMCKRSHFNRDDSLVYPGQSGRAHLHMYWGNTASDANSTAESIRTSGNSTCGGGIANRSTYWVPAMIDTSDGSVIDMSYADVYYKTGYSGIKNEQIKPIPRGLRMIAGDMLKTTKDQWFSYHDFVCEANGKRETAIPGGCTSGQLLMQISFPQCWNGRDLTAPDNKSHMAYASGSCPASHPVPLPTISYIVHFPIPAGRNTSNWRLSSDNYIGQGGNSIHADWINGWDDTLPAVWTGLIINRGLSGGSYMLGDGRVLD